LIDDAINHTECRPPGSCRPSHIQAHSVRKMFSHTQYVAKISKLQIHGQNYKFLSLCNLFSGLQCLLFFS